LVSTSLSMKAPLKPALYGPVTINHVDAHKTSPTGALWPCHGSQACRSLLRASHMPWQPSARLNTAGNESTIGPNFIRSSTSKELMTEVSLVLGGILVLRKTQLRSSQHHTQHTSRKTRLACLCFLVESWLSPCQPMMNDAVYVKCEETSGRK
jgi:hypothetical protein